MGNQQPSEILARENFGYRVIQATDDSPLEPFLDFILYTP